jgi:hypothetical protein
MHEWTKAKMSDLQKALGFELHNCMHCKATMNTSAYTSQGMPDVHYEKCLNALKVD